MAMFTPIRTDRAPRAIGPYSQAVQTDGLIFVSGQLPVDPATGQMVKGDIQAQTRMVMENIRSILEAAGSSLGAVVKTTIYVKDLAAFDAINAAYAEFFAEPFPARACVQVARLPKDADVEIEAVALTRP